MQSTVNSRLWDYSFISPLNDHIDIVRNNATNQLMLRCTAPSDAYPVMRAISAVRHENLMTVYDAQIINGKCVSLCEYIGGTTLDYNIEHNGEYDLNSAKRIMCFICDGLGALHKNGVVHRDIKPENIMIDLNGNVKIIDYNISRLIKSDKRRDTQILGTAGYAAPEQFGFSQSGFRADIYACGVLLNYLLTKKLPNENLYEGEAAWIISKCTEIDEGKRFISAEELKMAIIGKSAKAPKRQADRNFRPLPGFRSKRVFPKILTTILIICWIFGLFVFINGLPMILKWSQSLQCKHFITASVLFVFWSSLPYFLFGDIFKMSEKICPGNPKNGRYILNALGIISFVLGFILFVIAIRL